MLKLDSMDRLWRSNSSISSRTSCPPDIVNDEDFKVDLIPLYDEFMLSKNRIKRKYFQDNFVNLRKTVLRVNG